MILRSWTRRSAGRAAVRRCCCRSTASTKIPSSRAASLTQKRCKSWPTPSASAACVNPCPFDLIPAQPGRWMLNFGARRLRASQVAGLTEIPAFVDASADSYDQVIENEQREGLKPLELALFVQKRLAQGETQADIARRMGKSRAYVTYATALIDAPDWLLLLYREGRCRVLHLLYELRRLHQEHPKYIEAWAADRPVITRHDVDTLRAELARDVAESARLGAVGLDGDDGRAKRAEPDEPRTNTGTGFARCRCVGGREPPRKAWRSLPCRREGWRGIRTVVHRSACRRGQGLCPAPARRVAPGGARRHAHTARNPMPMSGRRLARC